MPEYEYEVRIKNLYDQKPTEEESIASAIAMAKAQLSLGISPEESIRILEKLEPGYLIPDPTPFIHQMVPMIPVMIQPIIAPLEYTMPAIMERASEPITKALSEEILPALTDALPFAEPDTSVVVKSSLKKVGRFFSRAFKTLYGVED